MIWMKSHKHAKQKKSDMKEHTLYDFISMKYKKRQLIYNNRKIKSSLGRDKRWGVTTKGHKGTSVECWKCSIS